MKRTLYVRTTCWMCLKILFSPVENLATEYDFPVGWCTCSLGIRRARLSADQSSPIVGPAETGHTMSLDITPLVFFCGALWIYTLTVNDIDELKHQINEAFTRHVRNDMLDNTWWELYSRLQMLQANGGSHIEVYELLTVISMKINWWNALLYCYVFCKSPHLKQRHKCRLFFVFFNV